MRRGQGRRVVVRAHALTTTLTTTLEATRQGLVDAVVSPEQADVILATVETLPTSPVLRAKGEAILVDHAGSLDATELAKTGRHLVQVIDPDAVDRRLERELAREERATHHARFLRIRDDGAGGVWVKGRGSVEDGALLKAALLPLTCPVPGIDHNGDPAPDPRDGGARMWDALIVTAQHALDTDLPPQTHGARPRVTVTLDYHDLVGRLADTGVIGVGGTGMGSAVSEDGLELPAQVIRRLACDADLIPAVLGSHGEVLDVGRVHRLITAALWVALVLRDRHCTLPGCTRPPVMCHAHHIVHWIHGGHTKLSNLALVCGHHHRIIHDTPWKIRINPADSTPEFLPPPKPRRKPEWIRQRPRIE
jgi:hypothetical protein